MIVVVFVISSDEFYVWRRWRCWKSAKSAKINY